MTAWYAKGEMGEYVLEVVEAAINQSIDSQQFINKLSAVGMNDQEIMDVFAGEVVGV